METKFIFLHSPDKQKLKIFLDQIMKEEIGAAASGYPGIKIHLKESLYKLSSFYVAKKGKKMPDFEYDKWVEDYFDPLFNYMISFSIENRRIHNNREKEFKNILKKTLLQIQQEAELLQDKATTILMKQSIGEL